MKRLSRRDLELLGSRVTKAYMELPENKGKQIFRIEPELLCESLLGLKLDYRHLSEDGSILGLTAFEGVGVELLWDDGDDGVYYLDGKTVLIESDLRESIEQSGRKNFTIVHEASHQILKMAYPKEYGARPHAQRLHYYRANSMRNRSDLRLGGMAKQYACVLCFAPQVPCGAGDDSVRSRQWD